MVARLPGCKVASDRELLVLTMVYHEIEAGAGEALEFCGAFRAGKVVADAEGVTFEFVDRRESLAIVRSFGAGNGDAFRLGGGIERVSAPIGCLSDKNLIFSVVKFEADALHDGVSHGLSGQLSLDGFPISLNCFGIVVGRAGSERIERGANSEASAKEVFKMFHDVWGYEGNELRAAQLPNRINRTNDRCKEKFHGLLARAHLNAAAML